ncbi:3-oxoacyl-[acyl-carrier-protein] synthase III C-terminal domain-containing protein [Methylocystis rosea]|uniref:3-oxoacyl-[acyl-carrier-protein] synthase III C-terminal domain-containing protein n=1 Tax=Methylocystis rosea TaxID=173366 RepID=UPI00036CFE65|nr:3-oxoacyl-[acyl-carrier-protein] synthase III C-terminal domain-containing protein [Methylocystis rosea]
MRIDAVKAALPSRKLSNEDILQIVRESSEATYDGDLDAAIKRIESWLTYSGAQTRYTLEENETPLSVLTGAIDAALEEAKCTKDDIDTLVYVGVGRGFIEPAGAYLVAHALGFKNAHCFDVLDACNSWSRGAQIIYHFLQSGSSKRAMIVNAEFSVTGNRLGNFALRHEGELTWTFPTYTIGEAATATILSADPTNEWKFKFRSRPDLADLCTIPVNGFQGYCNQTERIGKNGNRFTSYGYELFEAAGPELIQVFQDLNPPLDKLRAIFPHAASQKAGDDLADLFKLRHLVSNVYPRCGNLVSCSVPAAMAFAIEEQRVARGDLLAAVVASAGMSFSAYSFTY